MMNRIDRLMGLLTLLQSRRYTTAEHIAGHFGMSIRTVYRDTKALGEIGIPISFEPNRGYFIVQGYFLPPVAFSPEEANALVLMESMAAGFADASIRQHYRSALNKVKAVLKGSQKEQVEKLDNRIRVHVPPYAHMDFAYLTQIQQAISRQHILYIAYTNIKQEESQREIEPIGLTFYAMAWHLIAWCWKRKEYRDFKVARIQQLKLTDMPFRKQGHMDLNEYISLAIKDLPALP